MPKEERPVEIVLQVNAIQLYFLICQIVFDTVSFTDLVQDSKMIIVELILTTF
jgi:hypothetical protein